MPRPDVSQKRTAQILDAATIVFARSGVHQSSMDDIAREVGLSKGSLYVYFESKDDIIAAIQERLLNADLDALQSILASPGPASRRLLVLTQRIAQEVERMSPMLSITYELYAVALRSESVRKAHEDYFKAHRGILADLIQQGKKSGEFRDTDAQEAAIAMMAVFQGLILLSAMDPQVVKWKRASRLAIGLLTAGLGSEDPRSS